MFFLRRVLFIVSLESEIFAIKFGGSVLCSLFMLCYIVDAKPYAEKGLAA